MSPVSFALLGTGMVSDYHAAAIAANQHLGAQLAAVSHYDSAQFASIGSRFGVPCISFEALLKDPSIQAVCICTPSGQHAEQALACLKHGKHVIVEKPMALSLRDAQRMIRVANKQDLCLSVALQRRADPLFALVKKAIHQGDLGELTLASVVLPYYRDQAYYEQADWRGTWALDGGGVLMNQGIHIIDLLVWFMGDPVAYSAYASTLKRSIEVEDVAVASLRFSQGALASIAATTTVGGGCPHRIELYGTNGCIQIEGEGIIRWDLSDESKATVPIPVLAQEASTGAGGDPRGISTAGHTAIVADFIQAIQENRAPVIDGHEGLRSLAAIHGIYQAAGITVAP